MKSYEQHISIIDKQVADIIKRAQAYMQDQDEAIISVEILEAYEFAKDAHKSESRLSGEPYISHPVAATEILLSLTPDIATIQACLLHDVIEDTPFTFDDILESFWEDVANLCYWMEKLEKVRYRWEDRAIGSLRKMFIAMADDLRVIFIKLSDRLHNMQTLIHHPNPEKQQRIALETLNIYVPIAGRLGLYKMKNDLEDECFHILLPEDYNKLVWQLKDLANTRLEFQNSAILEIQKLLWWIDLAHKVDFRIKSPYSIYNKMQRKSIEHPSELYDIYGIRIVVPTVADCYRVLGEIHGKWRTLPNRFKDYIALPKPNGYQSLHTTVIWFLKNFTSQPTEIQIRTEEMHKRAEIWVAAHFEYKEKWSKIATEIDWVNDLKDMVDSIWNNDLLSSLKIDTFRDRIFVFTPKWDLINLPTGSTPIDYAYQVHTDLGDHITIAKVNGVVHPLDKELKNWDVVEVIIDKNRKPSPFWLWFVQTIKAKNNIKAYLRKWNKDSHRDRGKEIINWYLEKSWLSALDKDLTILKVIDGREFSTEERLPLLEQVGNFSSTPSALIKRILKQNKINYQSERKLQNPDYIEVDETQEREQKEIMIGGEDDISYRTCKNCIWDEIPNQIVAHINSRGQFTIHARDCTVLETVNKERLMNAYVKWGESVSLFRITFLLENKIWILKKISETLYTMGINIDEIHTHKNSSSQTLLTLWIEIADYDYLIVDRFIERIRTFLWDALIECKIKEIKNPT